MSKIKSCKKQTLIAFRVFICICFFLMFISKTVYFVDYKKIFILVCMSCSIIGSIPVFCNFKTSFLKSTNLVYKFSALF